MTTEQYLSGYDRWLVEPYERQFDREEEEEDDSDAEADEPAAEEWED